MTELPGMNVGAVQKFLQDNEIDVRGELRAELVAGGRSNLTYRVADDVSAWIVRRPPTGGLTPSAHDMNREWSVTRALNGTGVPVAEPVAFDEEGRVLGAPMTIVAFVDGRVVRSGDDLAELTDEQVAANAAELVRVLAVLHDVDPVEVGLGEFGRPDGYLERQVATWGKQWERVKTRDLADLDRLRTALAETIPPQSGTSIVHGDYRVDNTILDASDTGRVAAVVDWEMSTLGDPLADVALMCVYRQPIFDDVLGMSAAWTSDRYPSADALAQQYSAASGRDIVHWNFYLALANFKLGVIGEGITHRARAGAGATDGAEKAAEATGAFAAAGLAALAGS